MMKSFNKYFQNHKIFYGKRHFFTLKRGNGQKKPWNLTLCLGWEMAKNPSNLTKLQELPLDDPNHNNKWQSPLVNFPPLGEIIWELPKI